MDKTLKTQIKREFAKLFQHAKWNGKVYSWQFLSLLNNICNSGESLGCGFYYLLQKNGKSERTGDIFGTIFKSNFDANMAFFHIIYCEQIVLFSSIMGIFKRGYFAYLCRQKERI